SPHSPRFSRSSDSRVLIQITRHSYERLSSALFWRYLYSLLENGQHPHTLLGARGSFLSCPGSQPERRGYVTSARCRSATHRRSRRSTKRASCSSRFSPSSF